jgi:hypothetical protein
MIKLIPLSIISLLLTGLNVQASNDEPPIKQSSSGICHDESSGSYNRTKKYTAFDSISGCIAAGGRLPKSATKRWIKLLMMLWSKAVTL